MYSLGKRLRQLRDEKRWTLSETADKLGLKSHSTYSNWEYDRTQPDAEMLARIAELHNISVDYLITGSEPSREDDEGPGWAIRKNSELAEKVAREFDLLPEEDQAYISDLISRLKKKS